MPENGQNKRRMLIPFQMGERVWTLIQIRLSKFKTSVSTKATSIFKNPDVTETLSIIHDKYVISCQQIRPQMISFSSAKNITSIVS